MSRDLKEVMGLAMQKLGRESQEWSQPSNKPQGGVVLSMGGQWLGQSNNVTRYVGLC